MAPFLETYITKGIINDDDIENDRTSSINSDDVVVILNPTKYTLQQDSSDDEHLEEEQV